MDSQLFDNADELAIEVKTSNISFFIIALNVCVK